MTSSAEKTVKCGACGYEFAMESLCSTNSFGSTDLDTRPPQMRRATMPFWVHRCPICGYCYNDSAFYVTYDRMRGTPGYSGYKGATPEDMAKLKQEAEDHAAKWEKELEERSKASEKTINLIKTKEYQDQLDNPDFPVLANLFLCKAMVDKENENWPDAAYAFMCAAWTCDDAGKQSQAILCRKNAIETIITGEVNGKTVIPGDNKGYNAIILVDLLRRTGQFNEAQNVIMTRRNELVSDDVFKVLDYEAKLIDQGNTNCHLYSEAFKQKEK